jgi:predicted DNA-binding transcriptional regulator YafY
MPVNKSAIIRYNILDKCFRNIGKMYFIEDLVETVNEELKQIDPRLSVSKRQILEDIKFMESSEGWSADIQRRRYGKKVYYRYSNSKFSINNKPLTQEEINSIKSAIEVLSKFDGLPQFDWVYDVISVMENKLSIVSSRKPVVSFDFNRDLKGLPYFKTLFEAIVNKVVLRVQYQSYKDAKVMEFNFHPYHLKEFNNRWFVLGFNEIEGKPFWNLALDRIIKIEETKLQYHEVDIDWDEYFYDVVGVTRPEGQEPVEVVLLFNPERAPYVISKPLHPSQKKPEYVDDGVLIKLRVIPNNELMALILSFCPDVKVIQPESLKVKFMEIISSYLKD